jgi:CDP-diacylglycerol--glycerol-3-phosphate 3-phosphatidyltransferase
VSFRLLVEQLSQAIAPSPRATLLDVLASLGVLGLVVGTLWAHALAFGEDDAPKYERLAREQGGLLFGKSLMQAGYWLLQPIGRTLQRRGVTPTGITFLGLCFALGAATAILHGRLGLAGLGLLAAALCDALDGMVARLGNNSTPSGAVFDALVDRVEEIVVLAAIALGGRRASWIVALSLAALVASLMNSYVSAKAEVYRVAIPSGRMRRGERSAWLIIGCLLVPLTQALLPLTHLRQAALPLVVCVTVVALGTAVSALRRAIALIRVLGTRGTLEQDRTQTPSFPPDSDRLSPELGSWLGDSTVHSVPLAVETVTGKLPQR